MDGRIDVHAHLLPGLDDGCADLNESLACCRALARAGYSHAFCTPHVWPNLPDNNVALIPARVADLQKRLDENKIKLQLFPGGEINLRPEIASLPESEIVTYALNQKYVLIDLWADRWPDFFTPAIKHLQSFGLKVILAHPERMRLVQDDPAIVEKFLEMEILLQGNLQCLSDRIGSDTRMTVEKLLIEDRYFLLGSDTHHLDTLPHRLGGLTTAIELVGIDVVNELTIVNPRKLLPKSAFD